MLVIGNGRMITQDASNPFLENGAVAMDGNTIVMVGVTEEVKKVYPDAEFVDAKGGCSTRPKSRRASCAERSPARTAWPGTFRQSSNATARSTAKWYAKPTATTSRTAT